MVVQLKLRTELVWNYPRRTLGKDGLYTPTYEGPYVLLVQPSTGDEKWGLPRSLISPPLHSLTHLPLSPSVHKSGFIQSLFFKFLGNQCWSHALRVTTHTYARTHAHTHAHTHTHTHTFPILHCVAGECLFTWIHCIEVVSIGYFLIFYPSYI